jgi:type I restriction enzyme M protein
MTASIARMNLVLHGVEDSEIARGDTLARRPSTRATASTFDVVLANPPYSIKQWNREAWTSDPWGRNFLGTPPQGRADYAFFQHILKSMDPKSGRCASCFRTACCSAKEEAELRKKLVEPTSSTACWAWAEPLLQLADGGVRRLLPREEAAEDGAAR